MPQLKSLNNLEQLEQALLSDRPQLFFKHSNTCPISMNAFRALQKHLASTATEDVDYWMVVVQQARRISDVIADKLSVKHESPQAILVKAGKAIWHQSHFAITPEALDEAIRNVHP
ncbi:MAG: bacillithiol system redox-active protein YtxJ [Acidobacteriota bacterium]|nr:bacillithiol system redox-active protein YtxJ [Blastocatellia bacterium]MDW8413536.1 bacillithiol system redox-active protein YtxJ [Acidobacteriota bacterium]